MAKIVYDKKSQYKVKDIQKQLVECSLDAVYKKFANYIEDAHYYDSKGVYGSEHVMRMLYINLVQAMYDKLSDKEKNILIHACIYHDIGRIDRNRDPKHGSRSWDKLKQLTEYNLLIKSSFDEKEEDLIRFLIIAHSLDDLVAIELLEESKIIDQEMAIKLLKMLKDADSLERTRFNSFDSKHLRTETAKKLVNLAIALNKNKIDYKSIELEVLQLPIIQSDIYKESEKEFSEEKLNAKIPQLTKRMGATALYLIGLLYMLFKSNKVNVLAKMKIVWVLGYLISPIDFIPDILAGGLADDLTLILLMLDDMKKALDVEVRQEAKDWVRKWIPEVEDSDFEIVDNIIKSKSSFSSLNKIFGKKKKCS
ncbi:MAG: DUF1232 domain-containing protein [Candidatus Niameybacter stercoravium]|nr:DUF1232 domain-containing protein [Candidatus Niameybacter stercoravium]